MTNIEIILCEGRPEDPKIVFLKYVHTFNPTVAQHKNEHSNMDLHSYHLNTFYMHKPAHSLEACGNQIVFSKFYKFKPIFKCLFWLCGSGVRHPLG